MSDLLDQACYLGSTDVVGGVGGVGGADVLANLFEMQGLLRLAD